MVISPVLASLESVVLTLARPSPVALATSLAVIALPLASAARTALLVAPEPVRTDVPLASVAPDLARLEVLDGGWVLLVARPGSRLVGVRRRERGGGVSLG